MSHSTTEKLVVKNAFPTSKKVGRTSVLPEEVCVCYDATWKDEVLAEGVGRENKCK